MYILARISKCEKYKIDYIFLFVSYFNRRDNLSSWILKNDNREGLKGENQTPSYSVRQFQPDGLIVDR